MLRLCAALAALVLASAPILAPWPAAAQDQGDPPAEVARIAVVSGAVSLHQPGSQDWEAAAPNYPLAPGAGVWTEPRAHAAVDIVGARVHLDASSQLEVTAIDPGQVQLALPQGAAYVHVYPGVSGIAFRIDTAHGAAYIDQPGQYEIVAGDDRHPAAVSVIEGRAQFVGQAASLALQPGQRGSIAPDARASVDAAQPDDFVRMVQAAEQPYQQQLVQTAQYVSPQQTGYQDLARYGQWAQAPQYGAVWYPQAVPAGWAPYRYGHWAYVAPWGWTWVDDAPWGFTPFHYGRWVMIGPRWAWVPGVRVARPVYAPALVSFFDLGGVGVSLSLGWVPLGPNEVYVPAYRHSPGYVRAVNITNVRNETTIVNVVNRKTVINVNGYKNYRGATAVSRDVMTGGRPVSQAWDRNGGAKLDQQWTRAQPAPNVSFRPQPEAGAGQKPAAKPSAQPRPTWQPADRPNGQFPPKKNGEPAKNGAPQPYLPPVNGTPPKLDGPAAKPQGAAVPTPGKHQKTQQPAALYPGAQPGAPQPQPWQGQAAKPAQWKQPQAQGWKQPQEARKDAQVQPPSVQRQNQVPAKQQWKQPGQQPNGNRNAEAGTNNGRPSAEPQNKQNMKPWQNCGQQQPGAACPQ